MLIFHEGLPGSGKSYAAIQDHLLPAVKNGQKVFTNIKGINHEAIAKYCEIDLDQAQHLVKQIAWEDTPKISQLVENDSLVIIDELQDFWGARSKSITPEQTEFVTQHRQRGIELVACGQVLADCHHIWKRRVERKIVFTNQEAVGRPDSYLWTSFNAPTPEDFQKIASGTDKYKPEVYACYKSHVDNVTRTSKTRDDRFNPLKALTGNKYLWLYALVLFGGLYLLFSFFDKDQAAERTKNALPSIKNNQSSNVARGHTSPPAVITDTSQPPTPSITPLPPDTVQPAQDLRYLGILNTRGNSFVLVRDGRGTRYIKNPEGLTRNPDNSITFHIDGQKVTAWHAY